VLTVSLPKRRTARRLLQRARLTLPKFRLPFRKAKGIKIRVTQ